MRIGLFTDTYLPDVNGVVSSIELLRLKLLEQGNDVYVICTHPALLKTVIEENVIRLPGLKLKKLYGYAITQPIHMNVMKIIADLKLDIIHAHTEFGVGIFARLCSENLNIPLVSTYHTAYEDYIHYVNPLGLDGIEDFGKKAVAGLSKLYMDSSVRVIAPSLKTKEMLMKYGVSQNHIDIIPTGLDLSRFKPSNTDLSIVESIREKVLLNPSYKLMVFVGRLAKEKGIDLVIDAIKMADKNELKIRFMIVGSGPDEDNLKKRINDEHLEDYCILTGKVPQNEIAAYYHSADVFVSGSTTETQGMTYIEALTSGLPIIVRRDPVVKDLVEEDVTGYYFDDADELAEILVKISNMSIDDLKQKKEACIRKTEAYDDKLFGRNVYDFYVRAIDEYAFEYNIDSIRVKGDYVKLNLSNLKNGKDQLTISPDIYLEYGLRKGSHINNRIYGILKEEEKLIEGYMAVLKKVSKRDYSISEAKKYLNSEKFELDKAQIELIIERLKDKNILNDLRFAESRIVSMVNKSSSKRSIIKDLKKHDIDHDIIEEVYSSLKELPDEAELAENKARQYLKVGSNKSLKGIKLSILNRLVRDGFDLSIARKALDSLDFENSAMNEMNILKNKALKAKTRYSRKVSGTILRNKVFGYLINQGFEVEDIYVVIDEMDWE